MTIQGMSRGLGFSNMSYYNNEASLPAMSVCSESFISGQAGIGVYSTSFNMSAGVGSTGAAVIVFEVGAVYETAVPPGTSSVTTALADKLQWEYNGTYGSEYSAVHMGLGLGTTANIDTMYGMGYMRGMIGSQLQGSKTGNGGTSWIQPGVPLSIATGSRLTGATMPDTNDDFGPTSNLNITTASPASANEYELLDATQAGAAGRTHGEFKDLDQYDWDGSQFVLQAMPLQFVGPYTGHSQTEIADQWGNTYTGSSAVTLHAIGDSWSSRQAMMVVPIIGGGVINIKIEAPFPGTWHRHTCFCPIELPKWGNGDDRTGTLLSGSPYANATDAGNHNFSDPSNPTSGSVRGSNTTYYHVNSQNKIYRQEGYPNFTPIDGGNVIAALNVNSAGGTVWEGVVNRFDWVFTDNGGVTRVPVGFYAISIGGTVYVVEVGDTNTAGVAQPGVVKDITA
jgi:hypothetical protein